MPRRKGTPKTGGKRKGSKNRKTLKAQLIKRLGLFELYAPNAYRAAVSEYRLLESFEGREILIEAARVAKTELCEMQAFIERMELDLLRLKTKKDLRSFERAKERMRRAKELFGEVESMREKDREIEIDERVPFGQVMPKLELVH